MPRRHILTERQRQLLFDLPVGGLWKNPHIEAYYNRVRMHSANDYLSPVEYEKTQKAA